MQILPTFLDKSLQLDILIVNKFFLKHKSFFQSFSDVHALLQWLCRSSRKSVLDSDFYIWKIYVYPKPFADFCVTQNTTSFTMCAQFGILN